MDRKKFLKGVCFVCSYGLVEGILESCTNDHLIQPDNSSNSSPTSGNTQPVTTITNNTLPGNTTVTTSNPATPPPANNYILTLDLNAPSNSGLISEGGYIIRKNIIVINTNNGYVALSNICTHEGCTVDYSNNAFYCPCHNAKFNINGKVVYGPPPSPLEKYTTSLNGNILNIN